MTWNDADCLKLGRTRFGALTWGGLEARNQWIDPVNLDRKNVVRPTDAQIVAAVREGPLSAAMLQAFAQEYRVFHYPLAPKDGREARLAAIAQALDPIYRGAPDTAAETLARLWWQAIEAVRDVVVAHGKRPSMLRSFCMKMLWFYHPQAATMWDDYALRALNRELGTRHPGKIDTAEQASAFLADFERLFALAEPDIARILTHIETQGGGRYAYDRRVLDKALWLLGVKEDERVIEMMQRMARDPFNRAVMEHFLPELRG
ncbi:hypothetical protein [Sphingomonas sp. dw_22]|uniref:hypothetical protein n=1 Tax=Sphingomonas sp. dw_22 TaxID=2721175 RepID=UPI001BD4971E|nr:hypothetical protein [Sphingomonas sp. dw_22]